MADAFLLAAARTPIGKFLGGLADVSAPRTWRHRPQGGTRTGQNAAGKSRRSHFRQCPASRPGPEPGPAGGPQSRAAGHDRGFHGQQGLRLRAQSGHARRPGHSRRRRRPDRRRRHGIDEPGAAPAFRRPDRLEIRRSESRRFRGPRWPMVPVRRLGDGRGGRACRRRSAASTRADMDVFAVESHQRAVGRMAGRGIQR